MNNSLKIYGTLNSANFRKVIAVARELEIEHSPITNDVYKGEGQSKPYLSINKLGQIPTLVHGSDIITESNAILIYLAEYFCKTKLHASCPTQRARINQWLFWESSQWQPVLSKVMGEYVGHKLLPSIIPAPKSSVDWDFQECAKQLSYSESKLKSDWLMGQNVSLADFSVAAMTTYFLECEFPFNLYPNIHRWYSSLNSLDSWLSTEAAMWKRK